MSKKPNENSFPDNQTVIGKMSPLADRVNSVSLSPLVVKQAGNLRRNSARFQDGLDYSDESDNSSSVEDLFNNSLVTVGGTSNDPEWSESLPIQFIRLGEGGFEMTTEGRDYLLSVAQDRKVIPITVCGLYRTGKSYLLNLISGRIGPAADRRSNSSPIFQTSGTVSACTSGIWIWASSTGSQPDRPVYLLVDCEGSGNTANTKDHDSRLFAIAMLMSSYFMYNSRGVIDETSLSSLATVAGLALSAIKLGEVSQRKKPRFMWILRDFVLALEDNSGTSISSSEYLDLSLKGRKEYRKMLSELFSSLDCTTLAAPAIEEGKLQRLMETGWSSLRPEFQTQVSALRQKIFRDSIAKRSWTGDHDMTGKQLVSFLELIVANLNSRKEIPPITSVWKQVKLKDIERATLDVLQEYQKRATMIPLPMNEDELENTLLKSRKDVMRRLKQRPSYIETQEDSDRLKDDINSAVNLVNSRIFAKNEEETRIRAEQLLRQLWKDEVVVPIKAATTSVTAEVVEERISVVRSEYFNTVVGVQSVCRNVFDNNILPRREQLLVDIAKPEVRYTQGAPLRNDRLRPVIGGQSCRCVLM